MSMKKPVNLLFFTFLVFVSSHAFAAAPSAVVNHIKGVIMINTGENYIPARNGVRLKDGDQLMVLEGATATVIQRNGCKTHLVENTFVEIKDLSQCFTQAITIKSQGPVFAAALGAMEMDVEQTDQKTSVKSEVRPEGGALGAFVIEEQMTEPTSVATEEPSFLASLGPTIAVPAALTGAVLFSTLAGGGGESKTTKKTPLSAQ